MILNWISGLFGKKKYVEKVSIKVEEPPVTQISTEPDRPSSFGYKISWFAVNTKNNPKYWEREDLVFPDEDITMEIAGAWGFNPQALEEINTISERPGIIGRFNTTAWE